MDTWKIFWKDKNPRGKKIQLDLYSPEGLLTATLEIPTKDASEEKAQKAFVRKGFLPKKANVVHEGNTP